MQRRAPLYDKDREEHYNLISALHKSMRGSDPDAALYWLARMLAGGEDPLYIARRLVRVAVEDIGVADPKRADAGAGGQGVVRASGLARRANWRWRRLRASIWPPRPNRTRSMPRFGAAKRAAQETGSLMPPAHILNAPTRLMKDLGYGEGYDYDHDTEEGFSGQNYFPDGMARAALLRAARTRVRARDRQAAGVLGQAAQEDRTRAGSKSQ